MSRPPNILWICTDQQRVDTLGCYGNPWVKTPHLDALAASGVRFENAFCQSPVCTPSRASFLTGRYPRTTRCRANGQDMPQDELLVTRILAAAGYTCGLSGKLHLSACHPSTSPATERRIDDGYAAFHWSHHPAASGAKDNWATNEHTRWLLEQGHDYGRAPFQGSAHVQKGPLAGHHQTTWCTEKALSFIEASAPYDRPWLFSVNMFDPHHPFDPPEAFLRPYLDRLEDIPLPNYAPGELDDKPRVQQIDHQGAYGGNAGFAYDAMNERDHRLVRAAYWAMCDLIDTQVGRMLEALERTGQLTNTLVIFMSDHGEMLGDHGIYLKGPYCYEPAIHVPLILSQPGTLPAGETRRALVELTDLAPTLLEAAGLDASPGMQGQSLWPLASSGADDHHRESVYCEYYDAMPWHEEGETMVTMVRTERHKLVAVHGTGQGELYNLEDDPNETTNLWHSAAHAEIKLSLFELLCQKMAETVDPLPLRRAPW